MNMMLESNPCHKVFVRNLISLRKTLYFFVWLVFFVSKHTPASAQDDNLRIAVAANLLLPMQEVKLLYEQKYGNSLTLIPGSSGKLTAQILNGAPYDIFLSADMKYPRQISREGHAAAPPEVLVRGRLVFWSKEPVEEPLASWLLNDKVRSLAIAMPELAPYGHRSRDWLSEQKIYDKLLPRLVFGESIGQVNQYINASTVDAALTATSAMHAKELKDKGYWKPLDIYSGDPSRLDHGIVILTNATAGQLSVNEFIEFIKSPVAEKIFLDFGYEIP